MILYCAAIILSCAACGETKQEEPKLQKQTLALETISNARQLGGYLAAGGKHVKEGVLLRSGTLFDASADDLDKLTEEYGLTTVIDLRTVEEAAEKPDPAIEGVTYFHFPIMEEDKDAQNQSTIIEIYRLYGDDPAKAFVEMARAGALADGMYTSCFDSEMALTAYRRLFDVLLSKEEGAVLWHCTGGKDRAGLATVFVLSVLGVDEETILADFALTNEVHREKIAHITSEAAKYTSDPDELEQVAALVGVSVPHMRMAFDRAETECGSMLAFIQQKIGLTDDEVTALRNKYLE